jgi:hypothetical protein
MVSFCLVVMAALALERLAQMADDANATGERSTRKLNRFLTACAGVALAAFVVSAGTAFSGSTRAMGWARFALFLWITALVLRALLRGRITVRTTTMALVVLTATDLLVIDRHFIYTEDAPERAFAADDVVGYLKSHTPGRVWVFPFPQQQGAPHYLGNGRFGERSDYLMRFGISQAGGEHGNQLYRWNQFVGIAPGGNVLDWHNFVQHPAMMDAAAIRYILSGVRLQLFDAKTGAGLQGVREVHRGSAFVYVNNRAVARAQLVPSVKAVAPGGALVEMQRDDWDPRLLALVEAPAPPFTSALRQTAPPPAPEGLPASLNAAPGTTQVNVDEPDRVDVAVNATAPAMLVLNDNDAEGWRATIDGRSVPILRTNHTFRGVAVTPGNHLVSFRFEPHSLYTGLWISLATLATILAGAVLVFRESRQRPVTGA